MHKMVKTLLLVLMTSISASLAAAPMAYSVNSDSGSANADSLYRIDLTTGVDTRIAQVKSLGGVKIDVEGLAIAPDGTLYGVDDDSMTLFPINPDNAMVDTSNEVPINLPAGSGHDFGMSFACDDKLYITSLVTGSPLVTGLLYSMDLDGNTKEIGELGVNISALAAYGDPVKLYGLGNGLEEVDGDFEPDSPNLYEINISTGEASEIGPLLTAAPYTEGGLAFDDSGKLWAITDRRLPDSLPSQVMKIDLTTGNASDVK